MIQQKEIFKKIGAIIVEINEQYQYLAENPEQLNDLELELFSANADFLSEHVKILRRINKGSAAKTAPTTPSIIKTEEPRIEDIKKVQRIENVLREPVEVIEAPKPEVQQPKDLFSEDSKVEAPQLTEEKKPDEIPSSIETPEEIKEEPIANTVVEEVQETAPEAPATIEEPVIKEVIIPEKVATIEVSPETTPANSPAPTLNDIISAQKAQTIQTSQFTSQVITDLKTSISLNDKLLFIKDLFNGYSLAYSEAIEILNRFDNFDVAETFLKTNYATKNNWAAKQDTVEKFYEVLHRRYSK